MRAGVSIGSVRRLVAFVAGGGARQPGHQGATGRVLPAAMRSPPTIATMTSCPHRLQQAGSQGLLAAYQGGRQKLTWAARPRTGRRHLAADPGAFATMAYGQLLRTGGQSPQTIQIVNRLGAEFGVQVKVSDVFDHPRLDDFAASSTARLPGRRERGDGVVMDMSNKQWPLISPGKRVWVTGAGRGIGREVATQFVAAAQSVVGLDPAFPEADYPMPPGCSILATRRRSTLLRSAAGGRRA